MDNVGLCMRACREKEMEVLGGLRELVKFRRSASLL